MVNCSMELLPGLRIIFSDDGTWLHFTGTRYRGVIALELLAHDKKYLCEKAIQEWLDTTRANLTSKE